MYIKIQPILQKCGIGLLSIVLILPSRQTIFQTFTIINRRFLYADIFDERFLFQFAKYLVFIAELSIDERGEFFPTAFDHSSPFYREYRSLVDEEKEHIFIFFRFGECAVVSARGTGRTVVYLREILVTLVRVDLSVGRNLYVHQFFERHI